MSSERFIKLLPGERRTGRVALPAPVQIKARTEETEGRLSLLEVTLVKDVPRHTHHVADEMVYVLEGVLGVHFDGEDFTVPAGSFVLLPKGVPHALSRAAGTTPRVLQISSPGGWECYLEDLLEAGPGAADNPDGTFNPALLNPIGAPYGIEYEV
ncbi:MULTISPECIES: cupin domain-containing protein [unclassified Streptomyces]|uniref:cupin domain-containing protein n=1 Tax=unclassified Streptomyces TaxID=2593676 RepID=UPI001BE8A38F|nr:MULTISPECIES: cupin domain-containing protein [unclassified Streptomyces]MBT2408568.1 cupin domain-containing protein [Streptomyces sp. ISL-21]MBT2458199.1 cupin domain-containing protein [Streptomyces sp. ISL-86]MBT2608748.1 cupin domain-containing protein [Streptomyces sp. ISL-87]